MSVEAATAGPVGGVSRYRSRSACPRCTTRRKRTDGPDPGPCGGGDSTWRGRPPAAAARHTCRLKPGPHGIVSAVLALLFATVRARPGPFCHFKTASRGLTGWNGPGRARTVTNRAGTALAGAVRTGLQQAARPAHRLHSGGAGRLQSGRAVPRPPATRRGTSTRFRVGAGAAAAGRDDRSLGGQAGGSRSNDEIGQSASFPAERLPLQWRRTAAERL